MTTPPNSLGGRLALLPPAELAPAPRAFYDQLKATELPWAQKSGFQAVTDKQELIGPFNSMLRSPTVATAMLGVTSALKDVALSAPVRQVIILTVGAVWQAAYELYAHVIVARTTSLSEAAIQALAAGQSPENLAEEERVAHEFTRTLATTHQMPADLYQQALQAFGEQGVFDMVALAGQYMLVSALLNTFAVPAPMIP